MNLKWTLRLQKLFFLYNLMHPFDFFVLKKFRQVAHLYSFQQDFLDTMFIYIVYIYIYLVLDCYVVMWLPSLNYRLDWIQYIQWLFYNGITKTLVKEEVSRRRKMQLPTTSKQTFIMSGVFIILLYLHVGKW